MGISMTGISLVHITVLGSICACPASEANDIRAAKNIFFINLSLLM